MAKNFKVINGQIIRSPKRGSVRYTPISNTVLQNKKLSFDARGLLSYILSLPPDWILVKAQIVREHKHLIGTSKFNRIWDELKNNGYIVSEKVRDPSSGKFLGWCHVAYEEPSQQNTERGKNRCRIIPQSENHYITKDDITTKETRIQKKEVLKKEGVSINSLATKETHTPSYYELFEKGISVQDYLNNKF